MKISHFTNIAGAAMALALTLFSCGHSAKTGPLDDEEQQRLYALVAEPGAEGDYDRAIAAADSLLATPLPDTLRAYIIEEKGMALLNSGRIDQGLAFADTMIETGRRIGVLHTVSQGLSVKGVALRRDGKNEQALAAYEEGMNTAREDGDIEMQQTFTDLITIVNVEMSHYDEALKSGAASVEIARQLGDTATLIAAEATLATAHLAANDFGNVAATLEPYEQAARQLPPLLTMKFYTPLVDVWIRTEHFDKARAGIDYLDSLTASLPPEHQVRVNILMMRARLAQSEGRYADQHALYTRLDSLSPNGKAAHINFNGRAECLAHLGRWQQAYDAQRTAYLALDSIRTSDTDRKIAEIAAKYELLEHQNQIEKLSNERSRLILIIAVAVLLLAILAGVIIIYRRNSRLKLEQARREEYVKGLEEERNRVARELHDDVAGDITGLQLQLSILSPDEIKSRLGVIGTKVRRHSHAMMAPEFGDKTLPQLIAYYFTGLRRSYPGIRFEALDNGSFPWESMPSATNAELYRICQEAISNALNKARPGYVTVTLGGDPDRYELQIVNDGASPDTVEKAEGIGHRSIAARAKLIGAALHISHDSSTYTIRING